MKIATYVGARTVTLVDFPAVPPVAGQVQLELDHVGLCGIDLRVFRGDMDTVVGRTAVLGHEISARVCAVGGSVDGFAVGQRVTVLPAVVCGECPVCRKDLPHLCQRFAMLGLQLPGGLQQRWNVPAGLVVAVPERLSMAVTALVEPAAVAAHALARTPVEAGSQVLIVGGGAVGLLLAMFAASAGAEVVVVERNRYRRIVAATAGLRVLDPDRDDPAAFVRSWTAGAGADAAYELTGEAAGVLLALGSVAERGRLMLCAGRSVAAGLVWQRIADSELTVVGSSRYGSEDFVRAAQLLADGDYPLDAFVTTTVPLCRIDQAFAELAEGDALRVLVDLREGS